MPANGLKVLCEENLSRIHAAATTVLERRGVRVCEKRLRQSLIARGCRDGNVADEIVFPRELVAECLDTIDRRPTLHCVNGKVLDVHSDNRYYGSLVTDPYVLEYPDRLRRPVPGDIARHARLGDALPLVDNIHLMDATCPELPPGEQVLKALEVFTANTTTGYHCSPGTIEDTVHWIEVAEIMAGGSLHDNPILAAYVPTVSPLIITELNAQQLRMFLERGAVCNVGPCAIAGATAPYPVAGLIVQSWAEFLAMAVAAQVIRPGAPVLGGGGGAHEMEMSACQSLYSGPVKYLASAAMSELSEWLDIPTASGNYSTLCSNYGVQNGLESMMGMFATFFSRCNVAHGMGSLANACGMSAEQVVIHHDVAEMLERFRDGVDTSDKKLAIDAIVSVGPGGNFLEDSQTLELLRTREHFFASCYEVCASGEDVSTMADRAHEKAEDLMASHKPQAPEDRVEEVRRYVERELAGG